MLNFQSRNGIVQSLKQIYNSVMLISFARCCPPFAESIMAYGSYWLNNAHLRVEASQGTVLLGKG